MGKFTYPEEFERLWKIYPKGGKRDALKAWIREIKRYCASYETLHASDHIEWLFARANQYRRLTTDTEFKFLPDLGKWLRQGYYDIPDESLREQHQPKDPDKASNAAAELRYQRDQAKLAAEREYDRQARKERQETA